MIFFFFFETWFEFSAFSWCLKPTEYDLNDFQNDCMSLYSGMFKQVLDALLETTIRSLTDLQLATVNDDGSHYYLKADIVWNMPDVELAPNLVFMKDMLQEIIKLRLQIFAELTMWGQQVESTYGGFFF